MKLVKVSLVTVFFVHFFCVHCKLMDTSYEVLNRQKRTLIYLEGINWVQFIAGIGLPIEIKDQSITIGTVMKAFYLLPTNASDYTHPSIDYMRRRKRSSGTRWIVYNLIEQFFENNGYGDGKACLLRSICDTAATPFDRKTGILAEIIHAVFTPSTTTEELIDRTNIDYHAAEVMGKNGRNQCAQVFPECYENFLDKFTRFLS